MVVKTLTLTLVASVIAGGFVWYAVNGRAGVREANRRTARFVAVFATTFFTLGLVIESL